ncbi:aromatic acid exporter family protein, partial [Promicromonospora sukumoe]|uniref:aromatic acid exporter family protein n=1 Tax=Promicromonospora sukumoe TaxID=88382 RepID=UPI00365FBCA0
MAARAPAPRRRRPGSRLLSALRGQWARHPRWSLAAKGAVAAALAWFVALLAPAPFSEYPYYAPLGAVVAMTSSAVRSVRESAQAVGALLLGAVIARGVDAAVGSSVLSVALVVAVALVCAG